MEALYRLRVRSGETEVEAAGPDKAEVKALVDEYLAAHILAGGVHKGRATKIAGGDAAPSTAEGSSPASSSGRSSPRKAQRSLGIIKDLNLAPKDKPTLRQFYTEKASRGRCAC